MGAYAITTKNKTFVKEAMGWQKYGSISVVNATAAVINDKVDKPCKIP